LPSYLETINLSYLGEYKGEELYNELPNCFIQIAQDAKVSWAIYDNGIKDYSYHLSVPCQVKLHNFYCWEIKVE
jgi:hypothetical protein